VRSRSSCAARGSGSSSRPTQARGAGVGDLPPSLRTEAQHPLHRRHPQRLPPPRPEAAERRHRLLGRPGSAGLGDVGVQLLRGPVAVAQRRVEGGHDGVGLVRQQSDAVGVAAGLRDRTERREPPPQVRRGEHVDRPPRSEGLDQRPVLPQRRRDLDPRRTGDPHRQRDLGRRHHLGVRAGHRLRRLDEGAERRGQPVPRQPPPVGVLEPHGSVRAARTRCSLTGYAVPSCWAQSETRSSSSIQRTRRSRSPGGRPSGRAATWWR
jgi:hypothetical protein